MEVRAKLSNLRISPRKVRLVINVIRGLDVADAEAQLTHLSKRASKPILTLLKSAVANAENNFKLSKSNLFVAEIKADEAKTLYRYTPRAYGRATPIRKRASHISLVLAERKESPAQPKEEKKEETKEEKKAVKEEKPAKKEKEVKTPATSKNADKKKEKKSTKPSTK